MFWWIAAAVLAVGAAAYLLFENHALSTQRLQLKVPGLPKALYALRIVQVSDLQNKRFGSRQKALLQAVVNENPGLIVITGDLIDRRKTDVEAALEFVREAVSMAPVCYVPGNHEALCSQYDELKEALLCLGVQVLENTCAVLRRKGAAYTVGGIVDPWTYGTEEAEQEGLQAWKQELEQLAQKRPHLLLSHRPEQIEAYAACGFALVFCGHAHGGQVRLPWIGGLYAPHQGLFPRYTAGAYENGSTVMVVSRGLGNSRCPIRIGNRPQLISVQLQEEEQAE